MVQINFFLALALTASLGLVTVALLRPQQAYKLFQRKRYQYNATLALCMLTPTERFIFNSILFLTLTLLSIAACLYLPEHLAIITRRVYYYCFGEGDHLSGSLHALRGSIMGAAKQNATVAAETVRHVGRKTSGEAAREMLGM